MLTQAEVWVGLEHFRNEYSVMDWLNQQADYNSIHSAGLNLDLQ